MITIQDISKSFGNQVLFEEASFHMNAGDRIGLIGLNGHGKSTLLKIITGQEQPDEGSIKVPKGYRLGYLSQHMECSQATVLQEACWGLSDELQGETWKIKKALSGLGFQDADFEKSPQEFSHGYQMRIALVRVLVSKPNLLLLDEPTNFLDILSIRWLKHFLKQWPEELFLISHDRSFMDNIITHVVGIHRQQIRKMKGPIGQYQQQINLEEEVYERERKNALKVRQKEEEYIQKYRAKARRASQVQSRVKRLEKAEIKDRLHQVKYLSFDFLSKPFPTKYVGKLENLTFGYDPNRLIVDQISMDILYGEKVGIIGHNGAGKSTLLSLMGQELAPLQGSVKWHSQISFGYFDHRQVEHLNPDLTVEQTVAECLVDSRPGEARHICGAMMFSGDAALKKVGVLSGGEKIRVVMAQVIATSNQVLLLDEPTHHLDLPSCQALIEATQRFAGTVFVVTHDEYFLSQVATRLIVFRKGEVLFFDGGYDDFLKQVGWDEDAVFLKDNRSDKPSVNKKDQRRTRAEQLQKRNAILKPLQTKITQTEQVIQDLEIKQKHLNELMIEVSQTQDVQAITQTNVDLQQVSQEVENLYEKLFGLQDTVEQLKQEL